MKYKKPITPQARKMAKIIKRSKDVTRKQIAAALGKNNLSQHERHLLERLEDQNIIISRRVPKGHLLTYVYNINPDLQKGENK